MIYIRVLFVCIIILSSCTSTKKEPINEIIRQYDVYDLSTEGAVLNVLYKNNKITSSKIEIFGETGKRVINYTYEHKWIIATDSIFIYNYLIYEGIDIDQNSDTLIESIETCKYKLDYNGNVIWKDDSLFDIFNIFPTLKELNIITND